ncbi:MAG TPA: PaaI family thioesterase [Nocardioidaceae bacterium]|nr:PaaI family thioesterase [Nocardioidaceae bacterium]
MDVDSYVRAEQPPAELAEHDRVFGRLTRSTRDLILATMTTEIDHAEVERVSVELDELTRRLLERAVPGPLGIQISHDGAVRNHGNAVVGHRNPIAPPLHIDRYTDGKALSSFHLGPMYEGPPGLVHGGVSALILDQLLGEAAAAGGSPGMTGTLTLRYRRATPLGDLSAEAWIDRVDGYKTVVKGHLKDAEDRPTVEAEGLFVLPRWAREAIDAQRRPSSFE